MRVVLSPFIEPDLTRMADLVALEHPERAVELIRAAGAAFDKIGHKPTEYHLRPDIGKDARVAIVGEYMILYWIDTESIRMERIIFAPR